MKTMMRIVTLTASAVFAVASFAQAPAGAPAGATGLCKDGSYWTGASKSGACSGHKGLKEWYGTAAAPAAPPAGATGLCNDGTYWTGASKSGACSGHKGVKEWFGGAAPAAPAAAPAKPAAAPAPAAPAAKAAPAVAPGAMPAGATGLCKDGTYWTAASKSGACSGHRGVQEWYGAAGPAKAAAAAAPAAVAPVPAPAASAPAQGKAAPAPGGGPGMVWVNTSSKVYHCPGDQWYGKTQSGEYMTEQQAVAKGFRPDHGKACSSR